jgi:hypothetical protein
MKESESNIFVIEQEMTSLFSKIYIEPTRNGLTTIESSETPSNSQITNGFAVPRHINDNDSITLESQETQAGSTTNTQLDDEMEQEEDDEVEEEEEEDKPSSSSSPTTNLTDENSSSSNSNSTPLPSSSTEDMLEQ